VITMFVFWELTSLSSYFLIAFEPVRESSRKAALQALLVTGIGGLALLAGLLLLGLAGGSPELSALLNRGETGRSHNLYLPILLPVLAGACQRLSPFGNHGKFWNLPPGATESGPRRHACLALPGIACRRNDYAYGSVNDAATTSREAVSWEG
jgi:hypothetical protein